MNFLSFPDISSLHNVVRAVDVYPHLAPGTIVYRGKIKLHGTNAAVRVADAEVFAQSRSTLISSESDNAGFAKWVETNKSYWKNIWLRSNKSANNMAAVQPPELTIFGEWCGPGIMKGTAINKIPNKIFAIFAIMLGSSLENCTMITDPVQINELICKDNKLADVFVLPWQTDEISINFGDKAGLLSIAENINETIASVEKCDPWVKSTFNVDGIGEGIVYVPVKVASNSLITRKQYGDLTFKAKGEEHKVNKTKENKSVQIDPDVLNSVNEFVNAFATQARFEQGLSVVGSLESSNVGKFIKWVSQDVLKESKLELEAANLEWKQVEKSISAAARNWFLAEQKNIAIAMVQPIREKLLEQQIMTKTIFSPIVSVIKTGEENDTEGNV